jgi:hypothetical protein
VGDLWGPSENSPYWTVGWLAGSSEAGALEVLDAVRAPATNLFCGSWLLATSSLTFVMWSRFRSPKTGGRSLQGRLNRSDRPVFSPLATFSMFTRDTFRTLARCRCNTSNVSIAQFSRLIHSQGKCGCRHRGQRRTSGPSDGERIRAGRRPRNRCGAAPTTTAPTTAACHAAQDHHH